MAIAEQGAPMGFHPGARNTAASLILIGAVAGVAVVVLQLLSPAMLAQWGVDREVDTVSISLLAAGVVFMLLGGIIVLPRLGLGGAIGLIGVLFWLAGCISFKSFGWVLGAPLLLAFLGALTGMISNDRYVAGGDSRLIYRQNGITRLTHWVWAIAMFFLLLTALSEHIAFAAAYSVATTACVAVITVYVMRVLRSGKLGLAFGAVLAALYGMLYALLQAEDYSLLGGSLLLFALLAAVMLGTRRVDWYRLGASRAVPSAQEAG